MLAALVLTVGAACAGEPEVVTTPTPSPTSPTPEPTPEPTPDEIWPLTGLPAPEGVAADPVLVVKVDNTGRARPQLGLSAADLVVEELVEGGATRLAAMYHSTLPPEVVPVRSVRTSDLGLVAPTGGALVASGGAQRVLRYLDDAGLTVIAEGAAGFSRISGRSAPYNVAVDLSRTVREAAGLEPPAQPYLPWAEPDGVRAAGEPATTVTARFSGARATTWDWDGTGWRQENDLAAEGDEFRPDNVLVLRVTITDAGYTDPAGNFVPETVLEGSGAALLFTGGELIEAAWAKAAAGEPFVLTGPGGDPVLVPPGRTWIGLVPEAGDVTWSAT